MMIEFTPRELEIWDLIVEGLLDKQIAFELGISARGVRNHIDHLFIKTGTKTKYNLIRQHPRVTIEPRLSARTVTERYNARIVK